MPIVETHLDDLSPEMRVKAVAAFDSLAKAQRGRPEMVGGGGSPKANPGIWNATGLWTHHSEHVGDITHRIAAAHHIDMNYGAWMAEPKIRKARRDLMREYGFDREVQGNLKANYQYHQEMGREVPPFEEWVAQFNRGTRIYADAHETLRVYNKVQWHARQAAVALGQQYYGIMLTHINALDTAINASDWGRRAGTVHVDGDRIVTYNDVIAAKHRDLDEALTTTRSRLLLKF